MMRCWRLCGESWAGRLQWDALPCWPADVRLREVISHLPSEGNEPEWLRECNGSPVGD
jgi:hypothetical protein